MIIEKAGHYIVRVVNAYGEQYAHVELPEGFDTKNHVHIQELMSGPHEEAATAWLMFRRGLPAQHAMKL